MVTKWWFDGFIMFVILLSSAALAAEDPVQENSPRNKMLAKFDYAFTAIFFIECFLKVSERRLKNAFIRFIYFSGEKSPNRESGRGPFFVSGRGEERPGAQRYFGNRTRQREIGTLVVLGEKRDPGPKNRNSAAVQISPISCLNGDSANCDGVLGQGFHSLLPRRSVVAELG